MSMRSSLVLTTLLVAPALEAQNTAVIPPNRATTEGNSQDHRPFGYDRIRHHQFISRTMLTALGNSATITQLAYRRDGMLPDPAGTPVGMKRTTSTGTTTWQIRMANPTTNPLNPSSTFVVPAASTLVFSQQAIVWPVLPRPTTPPAPFSIVFPLNTPFPYTGGHLLIDHFNYDSGRGSIADYICDHEQTTLGFGTATAFGNGCPANENRVTGFAPNPGGGSLAMFEHGGPVGSPALACLGSSRTSWLGVPLPLSLASSGLPGCSVYIDFAFTQAILTYQSGLGEAYFGPVPADPALAGAKMYGQFANLFDDRVNPAVRVTTSEALEFTLGSSVGALGPQMSIVYATEGAANGRAGFAFVGEGPIVQLTY